jgi:probable F420-dependent oxidoreductase
VTVHFDLWLPTANPFTTPELLETIGREAQSRGVHRIWVGEHVVLFDDYGSRYPYSTDGKLPAPANVGLLDPFVTLSFLAAVTSSIRLGTAMCLLPQRNPVYTAKEVTTLDWLSHGRVDLGIGVGWLREEFEALGVPWPRRGDRTDEYVAILRSLWEEDPSSFEGKLYTLPECRQHPKPVQERIPIHVGGESDPAMRRVARLGDGWVPFNCLPADLVPLVSRLDVLIDEHGRSRSEVEITVCPYFNPVTPDDVAAYAEAGADGVASLFLAFSPEDVPALLDGLLPHIERAASL